MATTVFLDHFTGTTGTDIASRAPDTGTSWTEIEDTSGTNTIEIASGVRASPTTSGASSKLTYRADTNPALGSPDYEVYLTLTGLAGTGSGNNDDPIIIGGRRTDGSNWYAAGVYRGATNLLKLWKCVAGTVTELGSVAYSPVVNDILKLIMTGSSIKVQINGVDQISVTDSSLTSTGVPFLGFGSLVISTDDVNNAWSVDDFTVVDNTSAGGSATIPVIMNHLKQQDIS